ncbi:MAG TPA: hypothetical protein VNK82_10040 [Terriglobales bacterium]|nr:hypothetical protein [Terriglobales bacterium]
MVESIQLLAVGNGPPVGNHPNRAPFRGVLTLLDVPSDRPPAGARGHRVVLTRAAAEAALSSLLGMGLGYRPSLDGHDARRKVGVITEAFVAPASRRLSRGQPAPAQGEEPAESASETLALHISGYLFARDFPEVIRELRAASGSLGLSYEIADARVADTRAAVWVLTQVTFTGAAILRRSKAAYQNTSIELITAASSRRLSAGEEDPSELADMIATLLPGESADMNQQNLQQLIATTERLAAAAEALSAAAGRLEQHQDELGQRQQSLNAQVERIVAAVEDGEAAFRRVLEQRIADLERTNADLQAQAGRLAATASRKTLPPLVSSLLAKHGIEADSAIDPAALDKTLASLSLEQRIAVKSQMARAGIIE